MAQAFRKVQLTGKRRRLSPDEVYLWARGSPKVMEVLSRFGTTDAKRVQAEQVGGCVCVCVLCCESVCQCSILFFYAALILDIITTANNTNNTSNSNMTTTSVLFTGAASSHRRHQGGRPL